MEVYIIIAIIAVIVLCISSISGIIVYYVYYSTPTTTQPPLPTQMPLKRVKVTTLPPIKYRPLIHKKSEYCLDSDGSTISMSPCTSTGSQQWGIQTSPNSQSSTIIHNYSKKCLTSDGDSFKMQDCTNTNPSWVYNNNKIQFIDPIDGSISKCIDSDGEQVYIGDINTSDFQLWNY